MVPADQGARDRIPNQGGERDEEEVGAVADADGADVRDLGHDGGGEGDVGAGREAEGDGEDDDGCDACGGEPEREHEEGGYQGGADHDVEAADDVARAAGDDAAEDAGMVLGVEFLGKGKVGVIKGHWLLAYLAAFRMGNRYAERVRETPFAWPCRMMKLVGRKTPRKKKKLASETKRKRTSL